MKQRRQRHTVIALGLASLATMIAATSAVPAPVRFDNPSGPGHFAWNATPGHEYLTVLAGPEGQPGTALAPGTFWRRDQSSGTTIRGRSGSIQKLRLDDPLAHDLLVPLGAGEVIPSPVIPGVNDGLGAAGFVLATNMDPSWPNSLLPDSEPVYLGVSFNLGVGDQYGWIGIVRTGQEVDAFAWGYETEPGVPIAAGAPEPGTMTALVLGAIAVLGRRRRHAGR